MATKLIKKVINWLSQIGSDPHQDNIRKAAEDEVKSSFGVTETHITNITNSPPNPMKDMPRSGKAWFVSFAHPRWIINIIVVEVDDATETVTRVWSPPR